MDDPEEFCDLFISIGSVIIDDIVLPDEETRMGVIGGGATHAVMGMRVWSEKVGLAVPVGFDFPEYLYKELASRFDLQGLVRGNVRTPRAWQLFEADGTRNEVFRTNYNEMVSTLTKPDELPDEYRHARGVHLHCSPEGVPDWTDFLRKWGEPIILWEPWDPFCIPENRPLFRELAPMVDIFSPNLREAQLLTGLESLGEVARALLEDGVQVLVIRMGSEGSLIAVEDGILSTIPAVPVDPIVDVTGAGNSYCGGFIVGLAQSEDLIKAGCYAAVSASFSLEQFGALFSVNGLREQAEKRLNLCLSRLPNPRRFAFDRLAVVWDELPIPLDLEVNTTRIAEGGCPQPGGRVLDVGTGTGNLLPYIQACGPDFLMAMDLSTAMLERLKDKHTKTIDVRLIGGDAIYMPLADQSLTAVFCHGVFPHFPDQITALNEFVRVLQPGGRLVISHAIGREDVNAIHLSHKSPILRADLLPRAEKLVEMLEGMGWNVLEVEDSSRVYFILAEKPGQ